MNLTVADLVLLDLRIFAASDEIVGQAILPAAGFLAGLFQNVQSWPAESKAHLAFGCGYPAVRGDSTAPRSADAALWCVPRLDHAGGAYDAFLKGLTSISASRRRT
jgi:hypothetical protein